MPKRILFNTHLMHDAGVSVMLYQLGIFPKESAEAREAASDLRTATLEHAALVLSIDLYAPDKKAVLMEHLMGMLQGSEGMLERAAQQARLLKYAGKDACHEQEQCCVACQECPMQNGSRD